MSKRTDDLTNEITSLDQNETKEETALAELRAKVAELEEEVADATSTGDSAAVEAATAKIHEINQRISSILDTTSTISTASASTSGSDVAGSDVSGQNDS